MKYIPVFLLLAMPVYAGEINPVTNWDDFKDMRSSEVNAFFASNPKFIGTGQIFIINNGSENVVTIDMKTGKITYGPHYKPDEAAKLFWKYMGNEARCAQEKK